MSPDDPFELGIRLVFEELERQGRSQENFAKSLGVSTKHISQIKTGKANPTLKLLRRMWSEVKDAP